MNQPDDEKRPVQRSRPIEPHESALLTAAYCMVVFAMVTWPLHRMWMQPERDWQMLAPVIVIEILMPSMAIVAIMRWVVLRNRAGLPANPQRVRVARSAREAVAAPATKREPKPAKVRTPKQRREKKPAEVVTATLNPPTEQVDVALDQEPAEPTFVYPDVPDEFGEAFQKIMSTVRQLPAYQNVLGELAERYESAFAQSSEFRKAESFVIGKAERHPGYDPNAYAEPVKASNPALFLAQADEILPYAATVAAMVLIADQLPERVWDLLAAPWESVGIGLPQVVLA